VMEIWQVIERFFYTLGSVEKVGFKI